MTTPPITSFSGSYAFLSNFYEPAHTEFEGQLFPTSEHAFQAAKTLGSRKAFFGGTPGQAKRLGKQVRLRPDWESIKLGVMLTVLRAKFRDKTFRDALLSTGDAELVEGNTWGDVYWGVCDGRGENHLGKLLMKVRAEFAANEVLP